MALAQKTIAPFARKSLVLRIWRDTSRSFLAQIINSSLKNIAGFQKELCWLWKRQAPMKVLKPKPQAVTEYSQDEALNESLAWCGKLLTQLWFIYK